MEKSPTTSSGRSELKELDRIDRALLMALQEDARIPVAELSRRVNLTSTPCHVRLDRLEGEGYIESFGARINPERSGLALLAYITVELDRTTPAVFEDFHQAVQEVDEIEECHMTAGGFDYLLKIRVRSMADFRRFLGSRLVTLPGLNSTHTYFVIEQVKAHTPLNLLRAAAPLLPPARKRSPRRKGAVG